MNIATTSTSTAEEQRKSANLRVLQRLDDSIDDIVGSATYVVVYEFKQHREESPDSGTATSTNYTPKTAGEWQKCDIEGSLFIIQTREMKYQLIVLNRNSTRNMVVPIEKLQISSDKPFLIFRSSNKNTIHGIWFHRDEERSLTYDLMSRILNIAHEVEHQNKERNRKSKGNAASATVERANGLAKGMATSLLLSPLETNHTLSSQKQHQGSSTTTDSNASSQSPMILDKKNLQLALLSLIQDDRFIDLIHTQYVKIAHARNSNNKK